MSPNTATLTQTIPLVDLGAQHREIAAEVAAGFERVIAAASFIGGDDVAGFEAAYATFCHVRHCIGVANGTDALALALRAAGVGPGAEVVLPANTFIATAEAVVMAGARPVLADVDERFLLMDPVSVDRVISRRTGALMPVHLYGQMAPMVPLGGLARATGAVVIEDAAQAQGATWNGRSAGSFGRAAGTSFYPGKNLGAYGDAGAVLTDDDDLARRVRLLGGHGGLARYEHEVVGLNSRLDTLQAVVLSAKLRHLASWNQERRLAAIRYDTLLDHRPGGLVLPATAPGNQHCWHLYVVRVPRRDAVLNRLRAAGVEAGIHYPRPIHLLPAFAHLGHHLGDFPVAERAASEILSLPLYPGITAEQQERVAAVLIAALEASAPGRTAP